MTFDHELISRLGSLISAMVLWYFKKKLEARAKVVFYIEHATTHRMPPNGNAAAFVINTHTVVVKNVGKKAATNVRISHNNLPSWKPTPANTTYREVWGSFNVYPPLGYSVCEHATGGPDLLIPILGPGVQTTISYCYGPELNAINVTGLICSDEGIAASLNGIPMPKPSRAIVAAVWVMSAVGVVTVSYGLLRLLLPIVLP
jgi:hypothetical protein